MAPEVAATPEVVTRVRGEFLEMPGLCLTDSQARRLFGLDAVACDAVLADLIRTGFLCRTREGGYARTDLYGAATR
jgi:hypothetical protein